MALKKLPKNKADIRFINPETMEVECTYNQCFQKFIEDEEYVIKTPSWNEYKPIKHKNFFHKCPDCGRSYSSSEDKGKSIKDYESNLSSSNFTAEDTKKILVQLKKIYDLSEDRNKKKQIAEVFKTYKGKNKND